jgi:adenylate kinase family enzyme
VSVIGSSSGSGKTTFGRRLAQRLGLPFIELDAIHWQPNWVGLDAATYRERVSAALPGGGWVVDGNYGKLGGLVWDRADTLVWLDIPLATAFRRMVMRTLRRIRTGEELWEGTGNRETVRNALFARDSVIWYSLRTYGRRKRRWEEHLRTGRWSHLTVHRFRSNADADRWLGSLPQTEEGRHAPALSRREMRSS